MKKVFLLPFLALIVFCSCSPSPVSPLNNNNRYFKINFSGKTLVDNNAFATIMTINDGNGGVFSNLMIISTLGRIKDLNKNGNSVGSYYTTLVGTLLNGNYIMDNTVGNKYYDIDSGALFIIARVDASTIEGTFSCNLLDGSSIIPATGSFSLPHN